MLIYIYVQKFVKLIKMQKWAQPFHELTQVIKIAHVVKVTLLLTGGLLDGQFLSFLPSECTLAASSTMGQEVTQGPTPLKIISFKFYLIILLNKHYFIQIPK